MRLTEGRALKKAFATVVRVSEDLNPDAMYVFAMGLPWEHTILVLKYINTSNFISCWISFPPVWSQIDTFDRCQGCLLIAVLWLSEFRI